MRYRKTIAAAFGLTLLGSIFLTLGLVHLLRWGKPYESTGFFAMAVILLVPGGMLHALGPNQMQFTICFTCSTHCEDIVATAFKISSPTTKPWLFALSRRANRSATAARVRNSRDGAGSREPVCSNIKSKENIGGP